MNITQSLILEIADEIKSTFTYDDFILFYNSKLCKIWLGQITTRTIERNIRKLAAAGYLVRFGKGLFKLNKTGGLMVDMTDFLPDDDFLSPDLVNRLINKKGVIVGVAGEKEKFQLDGKKSIRTYEVLIDVGDKPRKCSIFEKSQTIKKLVEAFGNDSNNWLSKTVLISVEITSNNKQYVDLTPQKTEIVGESVKGGDHPRFII